MTYFRFRPLIESLWAAIRRIQPRTIARAAALVVLLSIGLILTTCVRRPGALPQVQRNGVLRVATVNSASTYYLGSNGPKGFEYDLARGFAKKLGVRLKMIIVPDRAAVIHAVNSGDAQMGVGLAISTKRAKHIRFTPPYLSSKLQAIYRAHASKPKRLSALSGQLVLPGDTALADWLRKYKPNIRFKVIPDANAEELMARIAKGDLDALITNADLAAMNQRYYPSLRIGFTLKHHRHRLAWAFSTHDHHHHRDALYDKAVDYLEHAKQNGRIKVLHNRYFGYAAQIGFSGGAEFARQAKKRLGHWKSDFKTAGKKYGIDWRLLAAISYQESHWDADATSPTHVRGMMMLTRDTAERMGVKNRRNPQQSINGGTRYLLQLRKRLPKTVKPPDRTWFALAAYNLGLGHVLDARRLLKKAGRSPDVWVNLRTALGWLSEKRYLDKTRFGYARGEQAATYVSNIRSYYDILTWMANNKQGHKPTEPDEDTLASGDTDQNATNGALPEISITSPAF